MATATAKKKSPSANGASKAPAAEPPAETPKYAAPSTTLIKLDANAKFFLALLRKAGFENEYKSLSIVAVDYQNEFARRYPDLEFRAKYLTEVREDLQDAGVLGTNPQTPTARNGQTYKILVPDSRIDPEEKPVRPRRASKGSRGSTKATTTTRAPRGSQVTATVEEMLKLLARIEQEEKEVNASMGSELNHKIVSTKKKLADASGDDFEIILRELNQLVDQKRKLADDVREQAFQRIEADPTFLERTYLPLLKRSR